jgi:hypothetical protein
MKYSKKLLNVLSGKVLTHQIDAKSIASVIDLIVSAISSTHLGVSAFRVYLLKLMPMAGKKAILLVRSVPFLIGDKPYLLSHG